MYYVYMYREMDYLTPRLDYNGCFWKKFSPKIAKSVVFSLSDTLLQIDPL